MRLLEFYTLRSGFAVQPERVRSTVSAGIPPAWGAALAVADIVAFALAVVLASLATSILRPFIFDNAPFGIIDGLVSWRLNIAAALCMGCLAMFWSKGLYTRRMPWWMQVQSIARVALLLFLIDGFTSFALKFPESRLLIVSTWLAVLPLLVCLRWLTFRLAARFGGWKVPTVIIGDNATVSDLIYAFSNDPGIGYDVQKVFLRDPNHADFDTGSLPASCRQIQVSSDMSGYERYVRRHPEFFYIISPDTFRGETKENIMNILRETGAAYAIAPSTVGLGVYETEPSYFFGHDIMLLQSRMSNGFAEKIAKRAMDIAIAGTALLFLAPLFAIVAGMLKFEGQGGTVFYGGKRIGYQGDYFSCWKFRSMEPDSDHLLHAYLASDPQARADWEKYRKLPSDPRVTTRTARFIRKASIDELPQLWNVLMGDMSIVGPRPILEDEQSYFTIDALNEYMSVRPGLTGLWQVSGRNATSFARRIHWDRWYIRNWSLWGDIVIIIKTPLVLLTGKGAH